jgi:hypothetical protein
MLRISLAFLLLIAATSLTAEINNIHYGYRNIYIGSASFSGSSLTVKDYRLTKQELEKEDTPFIKNEGKYIHIDINQLVRQYEIDELDPSSPILTYRFLSSNFQLNQDPQSWSPYRLNQAAMMKPTY